MPDGIRKDAQIYAKEEVLRQFEGRKGHGGGACTYRVVRPRQMEQLLYGAYLAGAAAATKADQDARARG